MPLYRLLQGTAFNPDDIKRMVSAYESVLTRLRVKSGDEPINQTIAQHIIQCAQTGERNPNMMCADALSRIGTAA